MPIELLIPGEDPKSALVERFNQLVEEHNQLMGLSSSGGATFEFAEGGTILHLDKRDEDQRRDRRIDVVLVQEPKETDTHLIVRQADMLNRVEPDVETGEYQYKWVDEDRSHIIRALPSLGKTALSFSPYFHENSCRH